MDKILAELRNFQKALGNNYNKENLNGDFESCTDIAYYFAMMLLEQGKAPEILEFSYGFDGFRIPDRRLRPVPYREVDKQWGVHDACVCDRLVYDPMLGEPVALSEYPRRAFGEDVPFKVYVAANEIQRRLELIHEFSKD